MSFPDWYLEKYVDGAEIHVYMTGSLHDFAKNLHIVADQLQSHLNKHSVEELLNPKTTPIKFSRPIKFENKGEARFRLIEKSISAISAAIDVAYRELEEVESDEDAFNEKFKRLRDLQEIETGIISRNFERQNSFSKENWDKLQAEVADLFEKYDIKKVSESPFTRLDRVVCKETQGVGLHATDKGVVLGNVGPNEFMQHEDPREPKVRVVWDGKKLTDPKDGEEFLDCLTSTHTAPHALELADPASSDPLYLLQALLYDSHEFELELDIPKNENGPWFLDIFNEERKLTVEYRPGAGFLFCTCGDPGYGPHADTVIDSVETAYHKTCELLNSDITKQ